MAAKRPLPIVTNDLEPQTPQQSSGTESLVQQDKIALEDARLRSVWEESSKKERGSPSQSHRKANVLLISWAPELDELQTSDEVEKLGALFTDKFNYIIDKGRIEKNDKLPQHQVAKYLADLVYNHDSNDSLLIIYYAGHGIQGGPGELTLAGNNKPNDQITERNAILWHEVESIVKKTRADVFIIFDCCFAGNLVSHRGSPYPRRNFEFLAATSHSATTPVPGPKSFTTALIWALEKLVALKVPFSTQELLNQIGHEAPGFPKKQIPILKQRYEVSDRRLMLAPIPRDGEFPPPEIAASINNHLHTVKEFLDLRFFFDKRPSEEDVRQLRRELNSLQESGAISATRIGWIGLRSRDIVKVAAMKWKNYKKQKTLSSDETHTRFSNSAPDPDT